MKEDSKIEELLSLIKTKKLFPQRFLIQDDKDNLVYSSSDKNIKNLRLSYSKYNVLKSSKNFFNRGKLIGDILLIEYMLSQIIFLKLLDGEIIFFDYSKIKKWNDFLDDLTFHHKIKLLRSWEFISDKEKKIIYNLKDFRNELAHSFSDSYFEYKKKTLKESFYDFEKDYYSTLNTLIKINNKLWQEQDLINKTIDYINKQKK